MFLFSYDDRSDDRSARIPCADIDRVVLEERHHYGLLWRVMKLCLNGSPEPMYLGVSRDALSNVWLDWRVDWWLASNGSGPTGPTRQDAAYTCNYSSPPPTAYIPPSFPPSFPQSTSKLVKWLWPPRLWPRFSSNTATFLPGKSHSHGFHSTPSLSPSSVIIH